ncbi:Phospholipid phosphatase 1 [Armadillidium vulgare]|nr:Phospholipid phosphatase 1 [Armadillidium vulgare]
MTIARDKHLCVRMLLLLLPLPLPFPHPHPHPYPYPLPLLPLQYHPLSHPLSHHSQEIDSSRITTTTVVSSSSTGFTLILNIFINVFIIIVITIFIIVLFRIIFFIIRLFIAATRDLFRRGRRRTHYSFIYRSKKTWKRTQNHHHHHHHYHHRRPSPTLYYQLLNENTYHPYKATAGSAGYDLAVPKAITIPKGSVEKICLDIKVKLPKRCYGRLALRSSSAMQGIDIRGGVIDNDYTGPIYAVLRNENLKKGFRVEKGARLYNSFRRDINPAKLKGVLYSLYTVLKVFVFGFGLSTLTVEVFKHTLGNLRPHFIDVCIGGGGSVDPMTTTIIECSTTSSNNDDKYIIASDSICDYNKENYDLIKNARLSFMSAHASISSFSCFFLIFYLQFRVKIKREHVFVKPVLQFVFFILTVLVSLSRIVDHHHHWYDVLAGFVNGILFAAFCCFAILKYGRHYSLRENEKSEEIENTHEQRYVEYEEDTIV